LAKQTKLGKMTLQQTTELIREIIQDPSRTDKAMTNKEIIEDTMAGVPGIKHQLQFAILDLFNQYGIEIEGMTPEEAAYEIYKSSWGLGPIEELYDDPSINEIRVNGPDQVIVNQYIIRIFSRSQTLVSLSQYSLNWIGHFFSRYA
jgi:pilus assembly protein CpaF